MNNMRDKPNILLLMTDQQRPDSLGCYGNSVAKTPNIDKLAENGVLFENCYVQNPLCCPSRYSILTGKYPHSHGVISNWYAPRAGEQSFGHCLKRAGYNTALIGKMHFTPWHDCFGFDGRIIAEAKFHTDCPDDYERFLNSKGMTRRALYDTKSEEYTWNCTAVKSKVPQELHIDSFVGRSVCEYIRNVREPFCLFASFLSPHNPYDPPAPYDNLFPNTKFPPRNMLPGEVQRKPAEAYNYINNRLKWPFKTDEINDEQLYLMKSHYYGLCTYIDDWVGRIIEVLKEENLYDNTIIIYTSDHGDLLGDHGLIYKQCFYEQSVKVPLIFHAPSHFNPARANNLVESIDIFNTICELGGSWESSSSQGKSLVPILKGNFEYTHREAVFSENYFGRMVRYGEYKMVYYTGKTYGELYNLHKDPCEQNNLWNKLEGSTIKYILKDLLLDWAFSSQDNLYLPVRPDHYDQSYRQYILHHGGTLESSRQPWYLQNLADLYDGWNFSEPGELR
ncbi:MAG: sulfatase-like hydrolase/transferase [Clostridiaceae bacterium]|nr:sulfatase-like hydrolase/transferase [Clostridiaceae bacterium]